MTLNAETEHLKELNKKIEEYDNDNKLSVLEQEDIIEQLSNIRGEPLRFGKSADIVAKAVKDMKEELQGLTDDMQKKDKMINELQGQVCSIASK